jgi:periplasmic divalent cation tolerance protein
MARFAWDHATLVLTTLESEKEALAMASTLVEERLAACGTLLRGAKSIYRWKGKIERAGEVALLLKTLPGRLRALERRIRELHPYDVPEVLSWRAEVGNPAYLAWLRESVTDRARVS